MRVRRWLGLTALGMLCQQVSCWGVDPLLVPLLGEHPSSRCMKMFYGPAPEPVSIHVPRVCAAVFPNFWRTPDGKIGNPHWMQMDYVCNGGVAFSDVTGANAGLWRCHP